MTVFNGKENTFLHSARAKKAKKIIGLLWNFGRLKHLQYSLDLNGFQIHRFS